MNKNARMANGFNRGNSFFYLFVVVVDLGDETGSTALKHGRSPSGIFEYAFKGLGAELD
jgi:hypothetical protein